jgi:glutathione S-transferase
MALAIVLLGCSAKVQSWGSLSARLPSTGLPEPRVIDTTLEAGKPKLSPDMLVLFRERHGWCPYSERVWLAIEAKGLKYETVLIDNTGRRPPWFSGTTLQVRWPDGTYEGESMDILRSLDERYPYFRARLWPDDEAGARRVDQLVGAFHNIFPRATRPSSRAAFLFRGDGPVPRAEFESALDGVNKLLGQSSGLLFHGSQLSAADCAWAPFLERYQYQLPCLHAGLHPRDPSRWPHLTAWYGGIEALVPEYSSRVQGSQRSWRKVLSMAGFGNQGEAPELVPDGESAPPEPESDAPGAMSATEERVWAQYSDIRPHIADRAADEAAARIVRNRAAIAADAVKRGAGSEGEVDTGLRALVGLLAALSPAGEEAELAKAFRKATAQLKADELRSASTMATFLDDRICVPRDMGVLPARCLKDLAAALRPRDA